MRKNCIALNGCDDPLRNNPYGVQDWDCFSECPKYTPLLRQKDAVEGSLENLVAVRDAMIEALERLNASLATKPTCFMAKDLKNWVDDEITQHTFELSLIEKESE